MNLRKKMLRSVAAMAIALSLNVGLLEAAPITIEESLHLLNAV